MLVQGLALLGAKAVPYIPHRQTEGHGLTIAVLKKLQEQGVSLVITVDCGVTDVAEVKKADGRWGWISSSPTTTAPWMKSRRPSPSSTPSWQARHTRSLTWRGWAWLLSCSRRLFQSPGKEEQLTEVTDLVAIGTIADMSPPLGENRYLIKEGLKNMNNSPRPGIRELINQTRLEAGQHRCGQNRVGHRPVP